MDTQLTSAPGGPIVPEIPPGKRVANSNTVPDGFLSFQI